jgi:predicted metal-binding membrane protein
MWVAMMAAMMLPATYPMVRAFVTINRRRRERQAPYVPTAWFVLGYLIAWSVYSIAAVALQSALQHAGLLTAMGESSSRILSGVLFLAAGAYQWTPLKNACLSRCRSPEGFVLTEWRDGHAGAIVMGLRHGLFCVGCCGVLMLLLFAVAVMNLAWVAALTVLVMAEKLLPGGRIVRHVIGAVLVLIGSWFLLS